MKEGKNQDDCSKKLDVFQDFGNNAGSRRTYREKRKKKRK